jgi:hypothetical protein
MVGQVTGAIRRWAKAPLLPSAALWEASVVVGLLKERECFEPDR